VTRCDAPADSLRIGAEQRESHLHLKASAGGRPDREGGFVRVSDGRHDGQAEPGTLAGAVAPQPLEGAQQPVGVPGGDKPPAVGHEQCGAAGLDAGVHREPAAADIVHQGVVRQVGDEALGPPGVAGGLFHDRGGSGATGDPDPPRS
jgi:hypothetical protein